MYSSLSDRVDVFVAPLGQLSSRIDAHHYRPKFVQAAQQLRRVPYSRTATLQVLAEKIGQPGDLREYADDGVPILNAKDVRPLSVNSVPTTAVPHAVADAKPKQRLRGDEVLVVRTGANCGDVAWSGPLQIGFLVNSHVIPIRPNEELKGAYLAVYLASPLGQALLDREMTGAAQRQVSVASLNATKVLVPDRRVQDYIGAKVELAERCRALASREHEKLAADLATLYQGCPHDAARSLSTQVRPAEVDGSRLDAWYHQRHFITLTDWLRRNPAFVELSEVASLSSDRWSPGVNAQSTFRYIEISNVDPSTGHMTHSEVAVENAPSRARKLVRCFDVLASTVRPNRGAVGLVPDSLDGAVATTGFAVVRPSSKTDAFFLLAVLRHEASTAQLMRYNTGSAYPAIEESVLPQIWIPGAKPETRNCLGARELKRTTLLQTAADLVDQAKADVEALIEGTLDVEAILAGTLKAPTAEDIPELAEDG